MDEYIDIVDKNGNPTGAYCLKSEAHQKGFYHNTVHVWLYTKQGEILLQQRALSKEICPGLWDVSAAGHVDHGEQLEDAALRETFEELGYKVGLKSLLKIGVFLKEQKYSESLEDNEFHHTYIAPLTTSIKDLTFDPEEVENIKLVTIKEFENLLKSSTTNNHFIASNNKYYIKVLHKIRQQL